ncbi:SMC-Scp complex subunit ScpB [Luteimonas notoginsengisoli]
MDPQLIKRIVEAALLAANQPLTAVQLHALFPLDEPAPDGSIAQALESLQADCAERGVELVELASGWRYQVQADVHPWVARLWTERQTRYTRATLETLALIAYRQPITRGEIEQVRGVAVNSNIIKALEEREWIRVVGHRDIPGRPELLGTTKGFLDYFGLKRLDELPPLSELKDFGELDPQLQFDGKPGATMPVGDVSVDAEATPAEGDGTEDGAAQDAHDETTDDAGADTDAMAAETNAQAGEADGGIDASGVDDGNAADADTHPGTDADAITDAHPDPDPDTDTDIDADIHRDADTPPNPEPSQDDTNADALADEGDSTRSKT